jgi:hypothetical protein
MKLLRCKRRIFATRKMVTWMRPFFGNLENETNTSLTDKKNSWQRTKRTQLARILCLILNQNPATTTQVPARPLIFYHPLFSFTTMSAEDATNEEELLEYDEEESDNEVVISSSSFQSAKLLQKSRL